MPAKNINNLSKDDIVKFYNFVCFYELEIKQNYGKYDFQNTYFQKFCADNQIAPKNRKSKLPYKFGFEARQRKDTKVNDYAHHLLRHIRNAFAHGLITKSGKIYFFKDFAKSDKNTITMDGNIRCDLFWSFLDMLINTKK